MRLTDLENLKSDLVDLLNEILQPGNNVTLKKNPRLKELKITSNPDHTPTTCSAWQTLNYANTPTVNFDYNNIKKIVKANVQDNTSNQKVRVSKNGVNLSTRKELNLIEGTNITLTVSDNQTDDRVDVTITSTLVGGDGSGDVVGPASSTNNNLATFDGITGKLIKDSGSKVSDFASASHNHDLTYAALSHSHDYAASNHTHDYSAVFAPLSHSHDYSASNHNHDGVYSVSGHTHDYAASSHNHDGIYSVSGHTHASEIPTQTGNSGKYLTTNGSALFWGSIAGGGDLVSTNNLSDVANTTTARNNLLPSKVGNGLKVLRVNSGATDYEVATIGSNYRTIRHGRSSHIAAKVAGTYALAVADAAAVTGTGTLYATSLIHIAAADFGSINGLTPTLRLKTMLLVNDVAPTGNFTIGLHPVTRPATSGGAGLNILTIGAAVSGSTALYTTPAADSMATINSSEFALPADGFYVLAVVTTATVATSSLVWMYADLQIKNA